MRLVNFYIRVDIRSDEDYVCCIVCARVYVHVCVCVCACVPALACVHALACAMHARTRVCVCVTPCAHACHHTCKHASGKECRSRLPRLRLSVCLCKRDVGRMCEISEMQQQQQQQQQQRVRVCVCVRVCVYYRHNGSKTGSPSSPAFRRGAPLNAALGRMERPAG